MRRNIYWENHFSHKRFERRDLHQSDRKWLLDFCLKLLILVNFERKKIWVILILACKLKLHFSVAKTFDSFQSSLRPALFHFIHFSPVRSKKMRSLTITCLLAFSCCKGSQYQGYWVILNFLKVISSENFLGNSVLKSALLSNSYSSVSIHDASYDANIWL